MERLPSPGPHGPASLESRSGPATSTPVRSSLSPEATPFYPSGGRGKLLRWKDATPSDGETSPPSYRDALLRSPPLARRVAFASELAAGGAPPLGSVLDRLGPALVILAGARRRLDALAAAREGAAPAVDEEGWTKARGPRSRRRRRQRLGQRQEPATSSSPRITPEFAGRCLNCLSYSHLVATCRLPTRCFRCHGFRHLARECKRPRSPRSPTASDGGGGGRRIVRSRRSTPPTPRGAAARGRTPSPPPVPHPHHPGSDRGQFGVPPRPPLQDDGAGRGARDDHHVRVLSHGTRRGHATRARSRSRSRNDRHSGGRTVRHSLDGGTLRGYTRSRTRVSSPGAGHHHPVGASTHGRRRCRSSTRSGHDRAREHHGEQARPCRVEPQAPMEVDAPAPSSSEPLRLSDEDLPAGHPALRPGHEVCFVSRCDELDVEEAHLRLALLAVAPDGSGAGVTADAMRSAVLGINGIDGRDMAVRKFSPEQFLIVFATQADRDCAFRAGWISVATSRFLLRPWTRLVRAEAVSLRFRVSVEMEGVPAHAASLRTARKILSSSCWIERLPPSSEDKSDQSVLKLTAWTDKRQPLSDSTHRHSAHRRAREAGHGAPGHLRQPAPISAQQGDALLPVGLIMSAVTSLLS
ncbi:hypothetical protein PVAP13_9NG262946 [Panicum virgatum]|uniref:CCHC-type domain-containing protein n=1 Tax=Panicum virgatum TaxID=38727 RepID=A0A8T0MJL7_PANVG|nr:hypothetical protein PVAP13_9NG262946 [Panicum virgatum]